MSRVADAVRGGLGLTIVLLYPDWLAAAVLGWPLVVGMVTPTDEGDEDRGRSPPRWNTLGAWMQEMGFTVEQLARQIREPVDELAVLLQLSLAELVEYGRQERHWRGPSG